MVENFVFNLPAMVDLMIHQADVMEVEAHAGEDLVHVPVHVLVVQDPVLALAAVAVMTNAVVAMIPTVEAKGRADQGHTAAVKAAIEAVHVVRVHETTEMHGPVR